MQRYSPEFLTTVTKDVFIACGSPPGEAAIVAEQLVGNNLMGMDSHGVVRIPQYVGWVEQGTVKAGAPVTLVEEQGGTAVVDCGFNFGQVGGLRAMEIAIAKAKEYKVACVVTRRCTHVGRLGYFTQIAAENGMFAMAMVNGCKDVHWVVPFGGREGRLATNPISYAVPGVDHPIVSDMATSMTAEGKVRVHRNRGRTLPEGWILDAKGNPSVDPHDLYGPPHGWILPLGGSAGHKGFALGLLVDLLSGTLAGDFITEDRPRGTQGVCFIVIDISAFVSTDRFRLLIDDFISYFKSTPPMPGIQEVMMPGEVELKTLAERQENGIPIESFTWEQIQETAGKLNVEIAEH